MTRSSDEAERSEGVLRRWSARKRQVADAGEPPPPGPEAPAPQPAQSPPVELPSLDSLDSESDYSPFLSPEVSADLRRLALRKLFHLPGMGVRDGLDDYDDDFASFTPLGEVVTQDMRRMADLARRALHGEARAGADQVTGEGPVTEAREDGRERESGDGQPPSVSS